MTLRLQNMMLAMLLALTTLFVGFGTLSQNPTSGGYQLFERAASGISADIQLASLGNFAPPPETSPEYANAPKGGLPDNGIDYSALSTAKPNQATAPRNLTEQSAWNGVLENPSAGRPLNLSSDPRFRPEDGFQKMETSTVTDSGQRVTIHYQYNFNTGQPYDIKIVYPPNP